MVCIFFGKLYKDARSDQDNIEKKIIASDEITKKSGEIVTSYSPKRKSTSPEYEANQLKEYTIAIKANNIINILIISKWCHCLINSDHTFHLSVLSHLNINYGS